MTNKERYRILCEKEKTIPIFSRAWWLDAVCGKDEWDVFLIGTGMDIKAALPYQIKENDKGKYIGRILLTQNNGLWIKYPQNQGHIARQSYEEKIVNEVCDYIEELKLFSYDQQYHYSFTNYLPFFWRYYKEVTKYTYVIEDTSDMDNVRGQYSSKLRNMLQKAQKRVRIIEAEDLELFYQINKMSFERQGIQIPYSFAFFSNLYAACNERNACKLLYAVDDFANVHSVAMVVWDDDSMYYLLNGTDPSYKTFQGNDFLIDSAIEMAHRMNLKFDFEGSVIKGVNHAFREFGGIPKPYFRISKVFEDNK